MRRRDFIRDTAVSAAALLLPGALRGEGLAGRAVPASRSDPVRILGRVATAGRGLAGVGVSDGLSVVRTDGEGRFELVADRAARWLHVCTPSGYEIPVSATGTAAGYRSIEAGAGGEMEAAFELSPLREDPDRHAFLVLADPQTENAFEMARFHDETVPDVARTVADLGVPTFGVGCGDIMYDDLSMFPEYERAVLRMGVPFVQVVGNHDLDFEARTDEASTATFKRFFGPGHYSFERGEVHYVVLDDVFWHGAGYLGYLSARQLTWLAADLAHVEAGRTVVVFAHIPAHSTLAVRSGAEGPSTGESMANREALYRLLEPYRAHVLSGHIHELEHVFEGGVHECVNGAVCGAWWSGDICYDGAPNGYGVYEVADSEVRWRYKATGLAADHQIRLYRDGDQVIANVWGWDPEWRVVWYEGGERRGAMERYTGLDPRSVAEHAGAARPPRREWVEPVPTDHLFRSSIVAEGPVTVEATDRFGRTYSAVLDGRSIGP
ncbi:MAG: calcineurin-like phosphoesterase family protein [Gemmatimonadota bacterium]|jgi:hypothetical protein